MQPGSDFAHEERIARLEQALVTLDRVTARALIRQATDDGASLDGIERLIIPALERIGEGWTDGRLALSQVYMAGRVCEELVGALLPRAAEPAPRRDVAAAVLEDYHVLGLRIVSATLRAATFDVCDYGRCTVDELVAKVLADQPRVLLVSTLMLPSALRVRALVDGLRAAGSTTRVIVGGAPFRFDSSLAAAVGADACGATASDALRLVRASLKVHA